LSTYVQQIQSPFETPVQDDARGADADAGTPKEQPRERMYIATPTESKSLADAVARSLERYDLPPTPDNYAVWYEYHAGHTPNLRRTIEVIISNNGEFDEDTLHDLYSTFIWPAREAEIVRATARSIQEALREVTGVALQAGADADDFSTALRHLALKDYGKNFESLRELVGHLVRESQKMAGKSQVVGAHMRDSSEKIEMLEHKLESALAEARTDGLTGLANRKAFDSAIRSLAGAAMNSGDDLSLLMIDVDRFKWVNDTCGHQTGDRVLCRLASTLKQSVRGHDFVARYGGEEFAVILPFADAKSAIGVADKIRLALAREPLQSDLTPEIFPITVSIGVSCYEPGDPLSEWIARADAALYQAKENGRNRVEFA
jgi:diguanylate cyclase